MQPSQQEQPATDASKSSCEHCVANAVDADGHFLALRHACLAIWPYIRNFGLFGASPLAVQAVIVIGQELGLQSPAGTMEATEIARKSRDDTLEEVVSWLSEHREVGRHITRTAAATVIQELLDMKSKHGEHTV